MQPVWNEPVLRFDLETAQGTQRWLAASEIHLGMENELAAKGAFARSRTDALAGRLLDLLRSQGATRLLLLGDVKQRVAGTSAQERRDVPRFFDAFQGLDQVLVTPGNHDVGLRELVGASRTRVDLSAASGAVLHGSGTRVGALHGHANPSPEVLACDWILVGHTHAAARVRNENGAMVTEWAWVRGRMDPLATERTMGVRSTAGVIVFPPFNPLLGGAPVNRDGLLGPFARLVDAEASRVVLLDGRDVGTLPPPSKDY